MAKTDASYGYLIRRVEEILDAHQECLTHDGTAVAGCVMYGDFEALVNQYHDALDEAGRPRKARLCKGPELVA